MNHQELLSLLTKFADQFGIPGAAAGLWHRGKTTYACCGVTSIDHPLPIDAHTLFQAGSIGKTFTASALLLLEAEGRVELDAPVRCYVPELQLADEEAAAQVTLLQLLNHTAGWEGDFFPDTGEGDDALARYVSRLGEVAQLASPGEVFSYNNAAFCLAGRIIEKVTGDTYEAAIRRLLLQPLGLHESFLFRDEVMTRRFVVGHTPAADGSLQVARPWGMPRSSAPAGGIVTSIADLLAWATIHAGGHAGGASYADEGRDLQARIASRLRAMRSPTVHAPGWAFGDALGIGWILSDIGGGAWLVSHGGSTNGQEAHLFFLPEHQWALALLTNASPGGLAFNREVQQRVLEACTGIAAAATPQLRSMAPEALTAYTGEYRDRGMRCVVSVGDRGDLLFSVYDDPEVLALMCEADEVPQSPPKILHAALANGLTGDLDLVSHSAGGCAGRHLDHYVFLAGDAAGVTGYFDRGRDGGAVRALHLFGRWLPRVESRASSG
ncbi:serine hydrolase [Halorhodospira abdelmalekii]|uniref:serine hydrolase domain-containing protein n=1 Tax=Halorhodospira abdelmalekii TaxID=421629 RepID=UPI001907D5B9|nr:serine hydrolase domain-containing protein [Halorhodospira abdelmalekii]MBK1735506.1 serine hydrolase [Halorhodospira abdelmalekii]